MNESRGDVFADLHILQVFNALLTYTANEKALELFFVTDLSDWPMPDLLGDNR
jgi:hypothetical protein